MDSSHSTYQHLPIIVKGVDNNGAAASTVTIRGTTAETAEQTKPIKRFKR